MLRQRKSKTIVIYQFKSAPVPFALNWSSTQYNCFLNVSAEQRFPPSEESDLYPFEATLPPPTSTAQSSTAESFWFQQNALSLFLIMFLALLGLFSVVMARFLWNKFFPKQLTSSNRVDSGNNINFSDTLSSSLPRPNGHLIQEQNQEQSELLLFKRHNNNNNTKRNNFNRTTIM